jgi:hypothetical protein
MKNANKKNLLKDKNKYLKRSSTRKLTKKNQMINEFKKDLRTNEKYKNFFGKYNPLSVESFIENYAIKKSRYITYGKMLSGFYENAQLRRQFEAEERLWEIQRKKLFDLECQWRAEAASIEGIELTTDFEYWERNTENCPFLTPISEEEFEMYNEYLLSEDFFDFKMESKFLSYKEIKENYKEFGILPPWFEYYDLRKGTGSFLILPDTRGEKEEYYLNIWQNFNSSKPNSKKEKSHVNEQDTRPLLKIFDLSVIEEFIRKYEDNKILEYFKLYESELHNSNDDIDQAVRILREAEETIPIESNYDWKSAIIQTARKFEQKKLSEALTVAYNKHKYRLKVGISQEPLENETNLKWIKEWSDEIKKKIIKARIINNEPADLNF